MSQTITIGRAGRIVLPAELRRRLNLGPGSRLRLDVVAHRIELTPETEPVTEPAVSSSRRTVLHPRGEPFDAAAAVRAEREAQARRGGAGVGERFLDTSVAGVNYLVRPANLIVANHVGHPGLAGPRRAPPRSL